MTESIVIIGIIIGMLGIGGYLIWYTAQYLYEWYVEVFTTDPDPDNPEAEPISQWEELSGAFKTALTQTLDKSQSVIELGIRTIHKTYENYRTQSYKTVRNERQELEERMRRAYQARPKMPRTKPPKKESWDTEQEIDRTLDNLGIDPTFRGGGKESWDTRSETTVEQAVEQNMRVARGEIWDSNITSATTSRVTGVRGRVDVRTYDRKGQFCRNGGCMGKYRLSSRSSSQVMCSRCGNVDNRYYKGKRIKRPSGTRYPGPS